MSLMIYIIITLCFQHQAKPGNTCIHIDILTKILITRWRTFKLLYISIDM